jgi:hypothetical protein
LVVIQSSWARKNGVMVKVQVPGGNASMASRAALYCDQRPLPLRWQVTNGPRPLV